MATQFKKGGTKATGNPVKVDVRAWLDEDTHKVKFEDEWEADWVNGKVKGPIEVPYGIPPTEIHFHLRDETRLHLNFFPDFADVMYVSSGTVCPPPKGNDGGQITFVSSANNLLKVTNSNSSQCDLKYALRFEGRENTKGGESAPYVYDPDLKNGGGGIGGMSALSLVIGVAAVACVVYVAYLAFYS